VCNNTGGPACLLVAVVASYGTVLLKSDTSWVYSLPYTYVGCYSDNAKGARTLPNLLSQTVTSADQCYALAQAMGDASFGLQYGSECWSGPSTADYGAQGKLDDASCKFACSGKSGSWTASTTAVCGQGNMNAVFKIGK